MFKKSFLYIILVNAIAYAADIEIFSPSEDDNISTHEPILIEFYTPWCGYCKNFEPEFERISDVLEIHSIKTGKIDCDKDREFCGKYNIHEDPSLMFFNQGNNRRYIGYRSIEDVTNFVFENMKYDGDKDNDCDDDCYNDCDNDCEIDKDKDIDNEKEKETQKSYFDCNFACSETECTECSETKSTIKSSVKSCIFKIAEKMDQCREKFLDFTEKIYLFFYSHVNNIIASATSKEEL